MTDNYFLRDLVNIRYGKDQKNVASDKGQYPIYGTGGLIGHATKFLYDKPSVLIGRKGTIDRVKYVEKPFWTVDTLFYTEINTEKVLPKYLFYLMSNIDLKQYNEGTTIPSLRTETLYRLEFRIPPLPIQKKIAAVLSALDDKIELNNKINQNLEQQAQAIFKSWFIDFEPFGGKMPDDWKIGKLKESADRIVCGKTPSTKKVDYYGNDVPFITIPDMHNNVYITKTERSLSVKGANSQANKTIPCNSICVSCIGTAGLVSLTSENSQTNQQINSILPKSNISPYFIYLQMHSLSSSIQMLGAAGSTICNLNKSQFSDMEFLLPNIDILSKFHDRVKFYFSLILSNQRENLRLAQLRDALLPKLMSGEIDVSRVNICDN